MIKLMLTAAILASAFAVPAIAMDTKCDDATIMKMDTETKAMTDMAMKDKAMKEMDMAKDSMKMNKMDDCKMHMDNAMKSMM